MYASRVNGIYVGPSAKVHLSQVFSSGERDPGLNWKSGYYISKPFLSTLVLGH